MSQHQHQHEYEHEHEPDHESPPVTPAWVKACGAIALILVVLFVVLHLTGHAPMGHGG